MHVLVEIALKSLLITSLTLGLLRLMKTRSAAERSWVAHIGLLALVIMALAPLALPSWRVEAPALLGSSAETAPLVQTSQRTSVAKAATPMASPAIAVASKALPVRPSLSPVAAATAIYALPAAILLFITLLAWARLVALRARAEVLVDGHWLSALARAQRRMGFKHGTALLTSDDLASPISWGLMRPVILLNSRAVEATSEAEAIIAHELAHVARMDWLKLLLARVATALFWFNPLAWVLAREAHQLREEAADDSVLGADIADTDYAQLLVGVARHECPGLLLGAHGVAPSKSSLARRVARVLDGQLVRGPAARPFTLGVFAGAVLVAAPLAALTVTPGAAKPAKWAASPALPSRAPAVALAVAADVPADLPHLIAKGVSTSVASAVASVAPRPADEAFVAPNGATFVTNNGTTVASAPSGAVVTFYAPDAQGRRRMVAQAPNGAIAVAFATANQFAHSTVAGSWSRDPDGERMVAMKATGLSPEFVAAVRAATPSMREAGLDDLVGMRAVGVTPDYIRSLAAAGLPNLGADEITQARAVGLTADYVRGMSATGFRGTVDDFIEMRAAGVTPEYAARVRNSGMKLFGAHQLIKLKERDAEPRSGDPDGG
ncbi:MAG: M56 family metallopeptidase [Sphingomonas sp.]